MRRQAETAAAAARNSPQAGGMDDSACIAAIERTLGRRLDTSQRAESIRRCHAGEAPDAIADWWYRLEAARVTLNDPGERGRDLA